MRAGPKRAIRPCTHTALLQKLKGKSVLIGLAPRIFFVVVPCKLIYHILFRLMQNFQNFYDLVVI